ncbi:prolyl oligopeptidase-like protein [Leptodontidium sp. MPI-SDFR-AT-0119]|nr:prolyl oligopeptidase-like protein [Leptodontidium sp. MPI-SDFR-AT-0119]
MTPEEQLLLATPDPDFSKFLQNLGPPPSAPPADINVLRAVGQAKPAQHPAAGVKLQERKIPTRDGSTIDALIVSTIQAPSSGSPVIVWFHGGGFCLGDGRMELEAVQDYVLHAGAVAVSVSYRLAPEHKFPTAIFDGQDALKWVVENAASLNINLSSGFVVGGVSSGANIAAVLAHLTRDEGLQPPLTGQFLAVPPLLPSTETDEKYKNRLLSSTQKMEVGFLNPEMIKLFNDAYLPDVKSPLYNVFNHPAGHANLPPAYIQVCGSDPLRDEALLYEEILSTQSKVKTRLDIYPGLPHHFWEFFPGFPGNVKHTQDTIAGLKWLFGQV